MSSPIKNRPGEIRYQRRLGLEGGMHSSYPLPTRWLNTCLFRPRKRGVFCSGTHIATHHVRAMRYTASLLARPAASFPVGNVPL
jgi:hypothetical protein